MWNGKKLYGLSQEEIESHFSEGKNVLKKILCQNIYDMATFERYLEDQIQEYEYAKGGRDIRRGFYHPNPVVEVYIKGVKRGHLLKEAKDNYDFAYGFDAQKQLRTVFGPTGCRETEKIYIFPYKDFMVGFCFTENSLSKEWFLHAIELCKYENNQIEQYYVINILAEEQAVLDITLEEFLYQEEKLVLCQYHHFCYSEDVSTRTLISTLLFELRKNKTYKFLGEESSAYAMSKEELNNELKKYENLLNQILSEE